MYDVMAASLLSGRRAVEGISVQSVGGEQVAERGLPGQVDGRSWTTPSASGSRCRIIAGSVGPVFLDELQDRVGEARPADDQVGQRHVVLVVEQLGAVDPRAEQP